MADGVDPLSTWLTEASGVLAARQAVDGGWPFVPGQTSATEPTAMAALALGCVTQRDFRAQEAADWLIGRQRGDGMFSATPLCDDANWVTAFAGLAVMRNGQVDAADRAARVLLNEPVHTIPRPLTAGIYGYDTELRGWPMLPGDFSLNEPTCAAMIFLKRAGYGREPRVREAVAMLRDRAIGSGGWNYGEPRVWGGDLFPAVTGTAMSLLALADEQDDFTAAGLDWLESRRGSITSLYSLGWAAIAMNVLGRLDDAWRADAIDLWHASADERRGPLETALCLLGLVDIEDHPLGVTS
ncbi:MAG TPA: prenyltransferase/squalene oxidase repeat-containing protein [Phycisphaerae bacterium]|nr:prenyltransferase/squalene oxidase repeat-containing protein [Phycisphaerae bacterium]